jgi:hypothetical protein
MGPPKPDLREGGVLMERASRQPRELPGLKGATLAGSVEDMGGVEEM